jgi:hypothetical protein
MENSAQADGGIVRQIQPAQFMTHYGEEIMFMKKLMYCSA